jgi:AcrR family transcriptional regulator
MFVPDYARFPGKEALFTAVVMRNVARNIARFETYMPTGGTIEERLVRAGVAILEWLRTSRSWPIVRCKSTKN